MSRAPAPHMVLRPRLSTRMREKRNYFEKNFPIWKEGVRRIILERIGLELDDIHDFPYASNFENGVNVEEMSEFLGLIEIKGNKEEP